MRRTEHLGLCQWDLEDRILMDDFNADNLKVDSALAALAGAGGGLTVLFDESEACNYGGRRSIPLGNFIPDWSEWAVVGILMDLEVGAANSWQDLYYDPSTDFFYCNLTPGTGVHINLTPPSTHLMLLTPFHQADRPASGLLLAADGIHPFRTETAYRNLQNFQSEYMNAFYRLHRNVIFGIK